MTKRRDFAPCTRLLKFSDRPARVVVGDDIGLWVDCPLSDGSSRLRPALFLDRDGVVVEEVHFLRRRDDVRLCSGVGEAIARANAAGIPIVVVTNQSGIARGHFGWEAFGEVQAETTRQLAHVGARVDGVFACAYHEDGQPPFRADGHPWRKPNPGMLQAAATRLQLELTRSFIIGDRASDLEAGRGAGLLGGALALTGYGVRDRAVVEAMQETWRRDGFDCFVAQQPASAITTIIERMGASGP